MHTRRDFLRTSAAGLGGFAALHAASRLAVARSGAHATLNFDPPCFETGALPLSDTDPVLRLSRLGPATQVGGYPFDPVFFGDDFPNTQIPFHLVENDFPGGAPPAPSENVDVAVVGGGLGGLATAYLLRHRRPVLFELHDRFGGVSQGEEWDGIKYSLGGAYFITPDEGSFLERFYRELGANRSHRVDEGENPVELGGQIVRDFFSRTRPPEEMQAFTRYAESVTHFGENYPEIPLPDGEDNQWILDLDRRTFKDDVEERLGRAAPESLASAIQAYFYSSFNAGWEQISAAAGWNFVAAEEFGRWVCPGGNSFLCRAMWEELSRLERHTPRRCPPRYLRARCRVVDVRLTPDNRVLVTYKDRDGGFRSISARRVVMACPKHVCGHMIHDLRTIDPDRIDTFYRFTTRAYVVANVLLNERIDPSLYDLFLLRNGRYPTNDAEAEEWGLVPDSVNGGFYHGRRGGRARRGVLTLYWAIPHNHGRFQLIAPDSWQSFAERLAPQIDELLGVYGLSREHVQRVRIARWGHAMPLAEPNLIADGVMQRACRPIEDRIFFVNQDNWALPAVENTLLEAKKYADIIDNL